MTLNDLGLTCQYIESVFSEAKIKSGQNILNVLFRRIWTTMIDVDHRDDNVQKA